MEIIHKIEYIKAENKIFNLLTLPKGPPAESCSRQSNSRYKMFCIKLSLPRNPIRLLKHKSLTVINSCFCNIYRWKLFSRMLSNWAFQASKSEISKYYLNELVISQLVMFCWSGCQVSTFWAWWNTFNSFKVSCINYFYNVSHDLIIKCM